MAVQNTILDTGVRYAEPADVSRYIRNKDFSSSSDPTETAVRQILLEVSDQVDKHTNRAWRLRRAEGLYRTVQWPREIEAAFKRRRRRTSRHGFVQPIDKWGLVNLHHTRIHEITNLTALLPEDSVDLTPERGRDGDWWLDSRQGTLYVDASAFMVGPLRGSGLIDPARVEVDYEYGEDEQGGTDTEAVSQSVLPSVRRATAKLAAAELLETDQYGSLVASGPENVPDQTQAAQRLREQALDTLDKHRIGKVM